MQLFGFCLGSSFGLCAVALFSHYTTTTIRKMAMPKAIKCTVVNDDVLEFHWSVDVDARAHVPAPAVGAPAAPVQADEDEWEDGYIPETVAAQAPGQPVPGQPIPAGNDLQAGTRFLLQVYVKGRV